MTAETWDLVVDHHRSPMVLSPDDGSPEYVPECPPPGDGWGWRGMTAEDGFHIGHWIRRRGVKRGD